MQLVSRRELLASSLLQGRDHIHTPPRSLPVDIVGLPGLGVEGSLIATSDVLDKTRNKLFRHVHKIVVVGIGPVKLAGRELGVVSQINALVSELATDLIHTLQTTDDKHLQIQLWRDTHEQVHIQLVVMGDERLGGRTAGNGVHHGRLDLGEVTVIKEVSDILDDLGAGDEHIPRLVVHDQIQVPLAVALLLILEAVVFGREGVQARREKDDLGSEDRQLTIRPVLGASATRETDNADDITSPQVFMLSLEANIASSILSLANDLDLGAFGTDIVEDQFGTRRALGVNSTGDADRDFGLLLALLETLIVLQEVPQIVGDMELVGVRVRLLGFAEFVDSLASDFEVLLQLISIFFRFGMV